MTPEQEARLEGLDALQAIAELCRMMQEIPLTTTEQEKNK